MLKIPLAKPTTVQVRGGKCLFFLGDHWELIGPVTQGERVIDGRVIHIPIMLPDIQGYFDINSLKEDGTREWSVWGPRVN